MSALAASGCRDRPRPLISPGLMVLLHPEAPPFSVLRGCICSLEQLGNPEEEHFISCFPFPASSPHSPVFPRITFQINDLHSNLCLGSPSGEPKLRGQAMGRNVREVRGDTLWTSLDSKTE